MFQATIFFRCRTIHFKLLNFCKVKKTPRVEVMFNPQTPKKLNIITMSQFNKQVKSGMMQKKKLHKNKVSIAKDSKIYSQKIDFQYDNGTAQVLRF